MAQQSARRGWDNQGFPQCFEHALGDLDPVRELPYRPAAVFLPHPGRTDDSIRPRAATIPTFSLAWKGASTDGLPTFAISAVAPKAAIAIRWIEVAGSTESCRRTISASRPRGSSPEASRGRLRFSRWSGPQMAENPTTRSSCRRSSNDGVNAPSAYRCQNGGCKRHVHDASDNLLHSGDHPH